MICYPAESAVDSMLYERTNLHNIFDACIFNHVALSTTIRYNSCKSIHTQPLTNELSGMHVLGGIGKDMSLAVHSLDKST